MYWTLIFTDILLNEMEVAFTDKEGAAMLDGVFICSNRYKVINGKSLKADSIHVTTLCCKKILVYNGW